MFTVELIEVTGSATTKSCPYVNRHSYTCDDVLNPVPTAVIAEPPLTDKYLVGRCRVESSEYASKCLTAPSMRKLD